MPKRTLNLQYPLGGLDRRLAFQKQRPFTTPYEVNVRPEGTLEKRLRGGSRPGLVKSFSTRDSDNKVRLLTVMRSLNSEGRAVFADDFSDGTNWEEWTESGYTFATFSGGFARGTVSAIRAANLVAGSIPSINTDASFSLEALVNVYRPAVPQTSAQIYSFYVGMDDAVPAPTSSLSVILSFDADTRLISIAKNDVVLFSDIFLGDMDLGFKWFSFDVSPTGIVRVFLERLLILEGDTAFVPSGNNVGFVMQGTNLAGGDIGDLNVHYIGTGGGVPPEAVVQATNGVLRRESTAGALTTVVQTNITLASDRALLAVDRLGKLYIADHGNRFSTDGSEEARQTDGIVTSVNTDRLTSAAITDWTDMGIEPDGDWLEIISATGSAADVLLAVGLHRLATQSNATYLELVTGIGNAGNLSAITYRVTRGAKVYDSGTNTMTIWVPTTGSIPLGCSIIEMFRDRTVLLGDPENSGIWYMSRFGNPDDFNFGASATDRGRAIAANIATSDAGLLSLPLTACAAITEDYCLFSAESELYLLRGDPTLGGIMGNVSSQIGIGSRTAWCRIPDGSIVFLSRDGLYRFHPSQPLPQSMSREKLPAELIDVVQNTDLTVTLEYDVRFRGVHIFIAPDTAGASTHYWFDWETQSFRLVSLGSTDYEPFAITYDAKANHVLLGGRDGYIRHHDSAATDDDGIAVAKEIDYGPIPLNRGLVAIADSLKITLDDTSDDVSWTFRSGNSPEEAFTAVARASGTAKAGVNYVQPVRHSGEWGFLRLSTAGAERWAVEAIELYVLTTPTRARKI